VSDWLSHRPQRKKRKLKWGSALFIGTMQGIAILPGISRSGSTIAGALFTGVSKKEAADFSFLLSIPSILGSAVLELPDLIQFGAGDINWGFTIAGMIAAGVSGYFAIRFMLYLIRKKNFIPFAIYTAVVGILVVLDQTVFHLFF